MIYGAVAVPVDTPDTWGAFGTTETCTAQGFFSQLSMAVPLYYAFLSCYSWIVVVYGNFDPNKYRWIEKYIHIAVHLWPIGSALYLLNIQAFNSTGLRCWIASIPLGCGDESDIPCERGPKNISEILLIFAVIPSLLIILFPTFAMIALAIFVHRRHKLGVVQIPITAWTIVKQSMVYIGVLYWIYTPTIIHHGLLVFADRKLFVFSFIASLVTMSMGLWYALVYRYFSISGATVDESTHVDIIKRLSSLPIKSFTKQDSKMTTKTYSMTSMIGASANAGVGASADKKDTSAVDVRRQSAHKGDLNNSSSGEFSFNIFDGTAPVNSQYSEFIFDGDDDDEENDKLSTKYWDGCQNQ